MQRVSSRGFTIVELLIVIVVIGILAALVLSAFSGAQTKARNAQTVAAAKEAIKLLQLYKINSNSYPTGTFSYACIGEYDGDVCQYLSAGNPEVSENASFKSAIATVGTMPQPATTMFTLNGTRSGAGAFYRQGQQDVIYYLAGNNQTCDAGGVGTNQVQITQCVYTLP